MHKYILLLLAIYSLGFSLRPFAQQNTLLYSVNHEGMEHTSYLFGTMHVMSEERFFFPVDIEKYLSKCNALCLEIKNVSEQSIDPSSLFDSSKQIEDFCTASQWDSLVTWAGRDLLMSKKNFENNFKNAKPFVLMQFMLQNTLPLVSKSHEEELEKLADSLNLKPLGLETIEEQLNIFNSIEYAIQIEMLMNQLRELKQSKTDFETMETIYNSQNLDSLCAYSQSDIMNMMQEELLINRNLNWMSKIVSIIDNQSVFLAVGAAHLCGSEGLIELLSKQGYIIEGIKL